jgi:uncharacterized protein (DUF305 family)
MKSPLASTVSRVFASGLLVAACSVVYAHNGEDEKSGHGSDEMSQAMKSGMDGMSQMKMTGDTDKDFAMMMKMHHQQAVDMAKIKVKEGKSPEIKAMAAKMIKDQQREIAQMDAWLKKHP